MICSLVCRSSSMCAACFIQVAIVKFSPGLWETRPSGTMTAVLDPSNSNIGSLSCPSSVGKDLVHSVPKPGLGSKSTLSVLAPLSKQEEIRFENDYFWKTKTIFYWTFEFVYILPNMLTFIYTCVSHIRGESYNIRYNPLMLCVHTGML